MKKLLAIVVLGLLWGGNAYAICFLNCKTPGKIFSMFDENDDKITKSDPSSAGCVYNEFGKKIKCISYKYNETKKSGSYAKARGDCFNYLRKFEKQNYTLEGCS